MAEELHIERGRPIDLATAVRFLPLIAERSPGAYSSYALRWLARWLAETPAASIDTAAQVAQALAALPADSTAKGCLVDQLVRPC